MNTEGRLCVRYYHRSDGSILTRNSPVGLQAFKRRVSGISKAIASSVLSFFAGMAVLAGLETVQSSLNAATEADLNLIAPVPLDTVEPGEESTPESFMIMGDIALEPREYWANGQLEVFEGQSPASEFQPVSE